MRQADRRAGVLSLVAFASLGPLEPGLALAGLLSFVLASRAPQRRFALLGSLAAAVFLVAPAFVSSGSREPEPWTLQEVLQSGFDLEDWGIAWIFFVLGSLAGVGILTSRITALLGRGRVWTPERIEEPLREVGIVALLQPLGFLALRFGTSPVGRSWNTLLVLFPVALLLTGLVLIPAERTPPAVVAAEPGPARREPEL